MVNKKSDVYRQKCVESSYLPFSIAVTKGLDSSASTSINSRSSHKDRTGRIDLIATSYETLKAWILGINMLIKQNGQK